MATAEDVNLVDTWLNGPPRSVGAKDQLSDTFAVVTNHHKCQKINATGSSPPNTNPMSFSEVDSSTPSQAKQLSESAANLFATPGINLSSAQPSSDRLGVCTDTFGNYNPTLDNKSHDTDKDSLKTPIGQNPHENGLYWSPRLK